jgi:hypothetical protein
VSSLFDVATVIQGDGSWSAVPYDRGYQHSAEQLVVQDLCTRANVTKVAGGSFNAPSVLYTIRPFGAMVSAMRPNRCLAVDFPEFMDGIHADLRSEQQRAAAYVLWNGIPGWDNTAPFMVSSDVETVASAATVQQTVAAVLDKYYSGEVGEAPVLHLGLTSAIQLSAGNAMSPTPESGEFYLTMDGTPIVASPAYPTSGVAATGPVVVHAGAVTDLTEAYDYATNRTYFTTLAALSVEFDASTAVRAT